MVKPNELRIGNYVICKGRVTTVESVDDRGINGYCECGEYGGMEYDGEFDTIFHRGEIKPIPLVPEVLKICWGHELENGTYWNNELGAISKRIGEGYDLDDTESGSVNKEPILYLHQLQNIYFALTNKELSITL